MNLSNLKISAKLLFGFSVIVLLTALTGGLAIYQMGRIDSATAELSEDWLPEITHGSELQALLNDMRRAELQHVVAVNTDEKKAEAQRIDADIAKLGEVARRLESRLKSPAERQFFDKYKQEITAYLATSTKLVELSSVGPAGQEATIKYLKGDSRTAFRAIFKTLSDMSVATTKVYYMLLIFAPHGS